MNKLTAISFCFLLACLGCQGQDSNGFIPDTAVVSEIFLSAQPDAKDHKKIRLEWSGKPLKSDRFFTIERSRNAKDFEVIGVIKGKREQWHFEFIDEFPATANNFYRIKTMLSEEKTVYSKIISRGISVPGFARFYPNPAERYLIVRTESPVELKITDQLNKVRISKQLDIGLQLVDVNGLERGLYIISLFQKESNRVIIDKLMKN